MAKSIAFYKGQWFNYITCLASIFVLSTGEGSFLFQIVPYLEKQNVNAFEIGITKAIISTILALVCLLIDLLYKNRKAKLFMTFGLLCMQAMVVSEVIFPIFALRAGMSISFLGSLNGIKMIVAAIIRPLTGFILVFISSASLTIISLIILIISVISLPFVGLSIGLIPISILTGLSFGICPVTSATLSVENVASNA
jgi:hypothetical protein